VTEKPVLTVEDAATAMQCAKCTVEEMLRDGRLAGLKPGGHWIIPAAAFWRSLEALALAEAQERRTRRAEPPAATTAPPSSTHDLVRRRRPLPKLIAMP